MTQVAAISGGIIKTGVLDAVSHRPFPLPGRSWSMTQRWNDLLFAHWPITSEAMAALLPAGLELDAFDGYAWLGVVPFWMDRVRARIPGSGGRSFSLPFASTFPELNLRTYVRSCLTGRAGVYFFSLDAASPLAVAGARALFHLPYFPANMVRTTSVDGTVRYKSRRLFTRERAAFQATYRSLGPTSSPSQPGSLAHFLTERYCLFTTHRGKVLVGDIHHLPWPLEPAEAEIRVNDLPRAHGLILPATSPVLHFSKALEVFVWPLRPDGGPSTPAANTPGRRSASPPQ